MPPQPQIPGYQLLERIGAGAESLIFRARDIETNELVAIKHVAVETKENRKYLRHVENEYNILRQLSKDRNGHPPSIVKAFRLMRSGFLQQRKQDSLVMEFVDGLDLRRERRYPMGQMVELMRQVAQALSHLHARGIIHGDMKPENVIVNPAGHITLVDFGFSCPTGSQLTSIRGTRDYMAPEQVDMGTLTEKTDIYNFGATMYFLFSGRHVPALIPQPGDSSHFIGSRAMEAPPLNELIPNVPAPLDEIVARCIRKYAHQRPSCIEEVGSVLSEVGKKYFG